MSKEKKQEEKLPPHKVYTAPQKVYTAEDFKNFSKREFVDISHEQFRTYAYGGNNYITVVNPLKLYVAAGGHDIFDAQGLVHYVPAGFIHMWFKPHEGKPHFTENT